MPGPNVLLRVSGFTRFGQVEGFDHAFERLPPVRRKDRLRRRLRVKKSLPMPVFRGMNSDPAHRSSPPAPLPSAKGRPAVPCRLLTPVTMLNGSDEYDCSIVLSRKPWLMCSQAVVAGCHRRIDGGR